MKPTTWLISGAVRDGVDVVPEQGRTNGYMAPDAIRPMKDAVALAAGMRDGDGGSVDVIGVPSFAYLTLEYAKSQELA